MTAFATTDVIEFDTVSANKLHRRQAVIDLGHGGSEKEFTRLPTRWTRNGIEQRCAKAYSVEVS